MKKTCVYVIIPVYNGEKYLEEAVVSVLSQPYQNISIVLVDDGSTDGSPQLCDALAEKNSRIHVIHQKNAGVSAARNAGVDHVLSCGDLEKDCIAFLDADDIWLPNAITSELFQEEENCDLYILGSLGADRALTRHSVTAAHREEVIRDVPALVWENNGHFGSWLYGCRLLQEYGIRFIRNTNYAEDSMFMTNCLYLAQKARRSSRWLHVYRHNPGSVLHRRDRIRPIAYYSQLIAGWLELDERVNGWTGKTGQTSDMGPRLIPGYFVSMAAEHYRRWGSRKELEEALASHPQYARFRTVTQAEVTPGQYRKYLQMHRSPRLFRLKEGCKGLLYQLRDMALGIPPVFKLYMRRKYPTAGLPQNECL